MMSKLLTIFLVASAVILSVSADDDVDANALSLLEDFSELATKLKRGDSCSWEAEATRQAFIASTTKDITPEDKKEAMGEFVATIVTEGTPLCSALSSLVCNRESQTCECGEPEKIVLLGETEGVKGYVTEMGPDAQERCTWAEKYACAPSDYMEKDAEENINAGLTAEMTRCEEGTSCKMRGQGNVCTMRNALLYVLMNRLSNRRAIADHMYSGKICTCQSDREIESDTELEKTPYDFDRVKRFAQVSLVPLDPFAEAEIAAGLTAPAVIIL